ncbi:hypothetical protein C8R42DRAFT_677554 [Lentinula raphanica]|nr:hypothetical protein C8R42DRAFT_677554 [Lentinula raphanica]
MNTSSPAAKSPYKHTTIGEFFPPSGSYPSSSGWPDDISPNCIQPTAITMRFITKLLPLITLAVHVAGTNLESGADSATRAGGLGSTSIELPTLTEPLPVIVRTPSAGDALRDLERGVLSDTIVMVEPDQQEIQRPKDSELWRAFNKAKKTAKMPGVFVVGTCETICGSIDRYPGWWLAGAVAVVAGSLGGYFIYRQTHVEHKLCPGQHNGEVGCQKISRRSNDLYGRDETSSTSCLSLCPHAAPGTKSRNSGRMEYRRRLRLEEDAA